MNTNITPADVLYHYCPVESLYHILDSGMLRLTNIRYMNDSKEMSWLFEIAKQVVRTKTKNSSSRTNEEGKLCKMLLDHCDNLYLDETFFPNVFCSCFSRKSDSLSQWRAYASDGRGVAIGFNREYLNSFALDECTRLADVRYLRESDVTQLESELEEAFSSLKESSPPLMDDEISLIGHRTEALWDLRAPFCKNAAFDEEDEVRLVHVGNVNEQMSLKSRIGAIQFFHRNDVIVPYIAMPLDPSAQPITNIVLGPRNRVEHSHRGIVEFARSKGFRFARDQFAVSSASYGELRRGRR